MNMSPDGGYLLSGIKIGELGAEASAARGAGAALGVGAAPGAGAAVAPRGATRTREAAEGDARGPEPKKAREHVGAPVGDGLGAGGV